MAHSLHLEHTTHSFCNVFIVAPPIPRRRAVRRHLARRRIARLRRLRGRQLHYLQLIANAAPAARSRRSGRPRQLRNGKGQEVSRRSGATDGSLATCRNLSRETPSLPPCPNALESRF
ncbi:b56.1 [miniopterid betaherpesvirus 1]|uniref:B56.1 n=1 Tax=miniopterid betaherpesvirus 1 TaxID=3070189 RepID=I3VQ44_9BETA|nr:b56.1 [miniopterid betaherpesvirus 1]AFK83888.1 b56.1 [miniopterid betaherpesvirus 1]